MISKNPHIIMNETEFVERLLAIKSRKTKYNNRYPNNLCYIHDTYTSADCVNLLKAILNGYDVRVTRVGYYQRDLSNTGDCTEAELLAQCTDVSDNFTVLGKSPEVLYMKGHIGAFLGRVIEGKYNVIECTKSFGGGVVYSWVDSDGTRRKEKGGVKNGKWTHHGKPSKWVSPVEQKEEPKPEPKPEPETKPVQKVYYVKKGDTLTSIAKAHGMSLAKLISYNPQIRDINKISIGQVIYLPADTIEEFYTVKKGDTLGSIARQFNMSLNKLLGLNPDIKNPNLIHVGDKIRIK